MRRFAAIAFAALVLAPGGHAAVTLGLYGEADHFHELTGQHSTAKHFFPSWDVTAARLDLVLEEHRPVPLMAVQPKLPNDGGEAITPRGIARGYGDGYLIRLSLALNRFGTRAYVRPMPEMNGHWSTYCAYNKNGTRRNRAHSQTAFKNAFRRIYVIVKGGSREEMNARLAPFGLPRVGVDLPENPHARVIWNPQGFGSPNVPGNMPAAYWPGPGFVDVVGNDLYDIGGRAMWEAANDLYRKYPKKPYAFPEWGLWGIDDPDFIRHMGAFADSHSRLELLTWYNGPKGGSIWDLSTKPASRRVYRRLIVPLAG
jgi:hypothetical protein